MSRSRLEAKYMARVQESLEASLAKVSVEKLVSRLEISLLENGTYGQEAKAHNNRDPQTKLSTQELLQRRQIVVVLVAVMRSLCEDGSSCGLGLR